MTTLSDIATRFYQRASDDESIEAAIARAEGFRAAVVEAGVEGLPAHLVTRGTPATEAEVLAAEKALATTFPEEYRSFLHTFGSLTFASEDVTGTHPVGELAEKTAALAAALEDEGFSHEELTVFDPLDDVLALKDREREPWEVEWEPPMVPIAAESDSNAVVLVPSLASAKRPAPVFFWYHDEAHVFDGFSPTLRAWVSQVVDDMIGTIVGDELTAEELEPA